MKANLLCTLAMLFLLVSCSEKDSPRPEPEPIKKYLLYKKASEISLADGTKMTINWNYIYDENNKLTRIDASSKNGAEVNNLSTVMDYDGGGRLTSVVNETGRIWRLVYDEGGKQPTLVRISPIEGEPIVHINTYNTLGRLVEQKVYTGMVGDANLVETVRLSYGKANLVSIKRTSASGQVQEASVMTDDRNRPLPMLPDQISLAFQDSEIYSESFFTEHNVTTYEAGQADRSFTGTYTYNEDGYPTASTKTYRSGAVERSSYDYLVK